MKKVVVTELKKTLNSGEISSVYLIEGPDAYFRSFALETLETALIDEPSLNIAVFDGGNYNGGDLFAMLTAVPFLSERRMVVIKEFYPKADALKGGIGEFLSSPNPKSVFVIVNENTCETLKKYNSVCVVSCNIADTALVVRWIKSTAGSAGVRISDALAEKVAEYCKNDMTRIKTETEKLIAYADGGEITEEAVELLVSRDTEYKIYEMTDYIAKRKFDMAIRVVSDMLGKGETEGRIISAVYNYFRRLLFVAISDRSNAETAELLGIKEYAVRKTKEQAAAFRVLAIKNAVDRLGDADYAVKSGRADADELLWINLFKIMTE
ncbi:MAG: DNA polymerase III subunit delta [Clostridia bacterium]|nr:DNA polymerase III subunit delta [Clostridia bacterium]